MRAHPDFRSPAFLRRHAHEIMAFYDGRCVDPSGGFFHYYKDDGRVYNPSRRHLLSSAGFITTHARMLQHFPDDAQAEVWRRSMNHGLAFLEHVHRDPHTGGYAWTLEWHEHRKTVVDGTQYTIGLAHVLMAHAHAMLAGFEASRPRLQAVFDLLEKHVFDPATGLYSPGARASVESWQPDDSYQQPSANMHVCQALMVAFSATGDEHLLQRAAQVAETICMHLAPRTGGLIWDHYLANWTPDLNHPGDFDVRTRPWGYQISDQLQWARLLLQIDQDLSSEVSQNELHPLAQRAKELFALSTRLGWDRSHDGLAQGLGLDHQVCDATRHHTALAEALCAAALLGQQTASGAYWDWYDRLWSFAWKHFIDPKHGGWWRALNGSNHKISDDKSPAGKVDLVNLSACLDILEAFETQTIPGALT
ncbi:MAG: AGE family epimerase/isomerase [Leptothrix ochracea]|uniref:AGE family epimerase/isomerase n=1 Tax=Leptothrix ochracea TaxID=735331 RepID=UPI0034E26E5E